MIGAYYDIEVYPNFLSLSFLDTSTPQELIDEYIDADIHKDIIRKVEALNKMNHRVFIVASDSFTSTVVQNDIVEFYDFIKDIKILIGFNSIKFDNLIIDHLLIHKDVYVNPREYWIINMKVFALVESIISNNHTNYKYLDSELRDFVEPFISLDLYTCLLETVERKSLKQLGIILKWYRIEDLPIKPGTTIRKEVFIKIIDYNFNDVLITRHLHQSNLNEVGLRADISKEYHLNLLSANRSKIAEQMLTKFYAEATGMRPYQFRDKRTIRTSVKFGDIINPKIHFNTPIFKELHEKLMKTIYIVNVDDNANKSTFGEVILYKDKGYKLGVGGLHSIDRPYLYVVNNDTHIMRDCDVNKMASKPC